MKTLSALVLFLLAGPALAGSWAEDKFGQWGTFDYDFDANQKPWKEIEAQLPPLPKPAGLRELDMGPAGGGHHYFVDVPSVTAASDGVVRYTVVIRTAGGAENVNFEGMRCATGEHKIYAFGHPDGSWSRNRYAAWQPVEARRDGSYQKELFFHYFCTVDGDADMKTIRRALERGGIRRGGD
ncbi:hypothetical protein EZJ19_10440 [Parasulfuritortus cantonensis]|uniref:CNP1-like uncharacterized domain-containing protein n=1 Tax=Parasulfuritortus cantonensis TaxID=2528202 RepID=A0A4R1B6S8_9PROT|nr:CNP1-like family protein [Parasulfuritortus cantonensis]TCJ13460.1 hypothetical protein EZJ19_10440 [Parasulfuritortus cantonensis]